jgi:hypothetical protein
VDAKDPRSVPKERKEARGGEKIRKELKRKYLLDLGSRQPVLSPGL